MTRLIILLLALMVVIPVALQAGYGFYRGYDVASGLTAVVKAITRQHLVYCVPENHPEEPTATEWRPVTWRGELEDETLSEASGLAASSRNRGVYFSVNDSGNEPRIFALGADGSDQGSWQLDYPGGHDFEDMAAFEWSGKPYLLVADTGDNFYWRPELTLAFVPEPDLETPPETVLETEWTYRFSFPDGYRDIEAVAVDQSDERIYLVSKRRVPPELFSLPLRPEKPHVVAAYEGRLNGIPQSSERDMREDPRWGRYRSSPTAFSMRGRTAVLLTYRDAYQYRRRPGKDWIETLKGDPARIMLPPSFGLESGEISTGGDRFIFVGERKDGVGRSGVYEVEL